MYLKRTPQKSGRIYVSIVDNYYDKEKKYSRQITLEKLGYLDELEKQYEDPIEFLTQKVNEMKKEKKLKNMPVSFDFYHTDKIMHNVQLRKNFGYLAISKIYHKLGIHTFLINRQRHSNEEYNANNIMKMLVFLRLIYPASKKKTFEKKDYLFENTDITMNDVYRSLSFLSKHKDSLLLWLHEHVQALYGRDTSLVYYDVTNYYFEIDGPEGFHKKKKGEDKREPDGFRKKGVCKQHRPDPIIQMGLFMDNNGIPITYKLFAGNTNDCMTYRPNLSQIKREFGLGRAIVVADKGMNTGDNIWYTLSASDGYVFSMSVRGADKEVKEYVLKEEDYQWFGSEYKRKSRIYPRTILVSTTSGKKMKKQVDEKQVVFYSEKYDKRAKAERAAVVMKAKDMVSSPGSYTRATSYGAAGYIKNIEFDKKTGEVLDTGKVLELDLEKLQAEEALDGYYMIVSSEFNESDDRIIQIYRGLWKIEESFCITKSDLESRPVYVSTKDHIEAHFLTCFIALVIVRILEMETKHKYSVGQILESLQNAECTYLQQNYYLFDYYDDVLGDIGNIYGIDFTKRIRNLGEIKNIFSVTKN
jgi:transposase